MVQIKKVLVTGGTGYIGSHVATALLEAGFEVIIIDDLSNSEKSVLDAILDITGKKPEFYHIDITDRQKLIEAFKATMPDTVIHLAGLKSIAESYYRPLDYYDVNVNGTLNIMKSMSEVGCQNFVFSSSAAVYGNPTVVPISENHPLKPTNTYGQSKLNAEHIVHAWTNLPNCNNSAIILRYFNPVGAHSSLKLGENPRSAENLVPVLCQVAGRERKYLSIFGSDYDTKDGSGARDYIHILDLAQAHMLSVGKLHEIDGYETYNVGTGYSNTVLEMVREFERITGNEIPIRVEARRSGDVDEVVASNEKIVEDLQWSSVHSLSEMCESAWLFFDQKND